MRIGSRLKYDQIARELDIPLGTVATRLARARQKLRQMLAPDRGAPGDSP